MRVRPPYSFAINDPVNVSDPGGLDPCGGNPLCISTSSEPSSAGTVASAAAFGIWAASYFFSTGSEPPLPSSSKEAIASYYGTFNQASAFLRSPLSLSGEDPLSQFVEGGGEGLYGIGAGLIHIVTHPGETADALDYATNHPIQTVEAIAGGLWDDAKTLVSGDAKSRGRVAAEWLAPAAVVKRLARLGRTARIVEYSGGPRVRLYTPDLRHVTGKTATVRNQWIRETMRRDLPNVRFTYTPQYNPFLESFGIAERGAGTQIGPRAFGSRSELIDTLIHEELHHRWWGRGILGHHSTPLLDERFNAVIERYKKLRGL